MRMYVHMRTCIHTQAIENVALCARAHPMYASMDMRMFADPLERGHNATHLAHEILEHDLRVRAEDVGDVLRGEPADADLADGDDDQASAQQAQGRPKAQPARDEAALPPRRGPSEAAPEETLFERGDNYCNSSSRIMPPAS